MDDMFEDPALPQATALKEILALTRIENDYFLGSSPLNPRWGRVYGGQLIAQSIAACTNTLNPQTHAIHSLHSYFLHPGDDEVPILYKVTRLKDTKAYVTRRVDAIQYQRIIFTAQLQFSAPDLNVHSHTQIYDMSTVPPVDSLPSLNQDMFDLSTNDHLPLRNRQLLYYTGKREIPFDIKWCDREDVDWINWSDTPNRRPAKRLMWVKVRGKITLDGQLQQQPPPPPPKKVETKPEKPKSTTGTTTATVKKHYPNPESTGSLLGNNVIKTTNEYQEQQPSLMSLLQSIALAYLSDWGMIATAIKPHPFPSLSPHLQMASLDHSLHFFSTNVQADEWLLFDVHSPHLSSSKALLCGDFYNSKGELVCRVQQQALLRVKNVDIVSRYPSFYLSDTAKTPNSTQNSNSMRMESNTTTAIGNDKKLVEYKPQNEDGSTSGGVNSNSKQQIKIHDQLNSKVVYSQEFKSSGVALRPNQTVVPEKTAKEIGQENQNDLPLPSADVKKQIDSNVYSLARL
jgi:acyl-CoA thioesterase II